MKQSKSPYICHLFVCMNDRHGDRKSCADGDAVVVRERLKDEVGKRGWKPRVRVSQSGCLGICDSGPNVMLYPQGILFSGVSLEGVDEILRCVEGIVADA